MHRVLTTHAVRMVLQKKICQNGFYAEYNSVRMVRQNGSEKLNSIRIVLKVRFCQNGSEKLNSVRMVLKARFFQNVFTSLSECVRKKDSL